MQIYKAFALWYEQHPKSFAAETWSNWKVHKMSSWCEILVWLSGVTAGRDGTEMECIGLDCG